MYFFLNVLFYALHLIIISFNLLGWIWPNTRKLHLIVVGLTLGSWLLLGIWYGLGYCFLTDWHWQVKEALGETNLPNSFVKYFADQVLGINADPVLIDWFTVSFFTAAILAAVYVNFIKTRKIKK